MDIILTVQPAKNKSAGIYRLGIGIDDSRDYFHKPLTITLKLPEGIEINVNIACGLPNKKCYDVNSKQLSDWIRCNNYHNYIPRKPTKLKFTYKKMGDNITLIFNSKLML